MDQLLKEYEKFKADLETLKKQHAEYESLNRQLRSSQKACLASVKHITKYIDTLSKMCRKVEPCSAADYKKICDIKETLSSSQFMTREMSETLPKNNGMYLRVVIGDVNLSFTTKQDKYAYKHDYERFKIFVSAVSVVLACILYFLIDVRVLDAFFHFLLVWYYCTLTIRERILIINGSRIKGWWYMYHFIMTISSAIMLLWPASESYERFRSQFFCYIIYLQIVHCVQYYYQRGCLYKLRALGSRHEMDITVDGFMSWMSRHLTFVIPFLLVAYAFQMYNAFVLYGMWLEPECNEWETLAEAAIFLLLSTGNFLTTGMVLAQKTLIRPSDEAKEQLARKYRFIGAGVKLADGIRHQERSSHNLQAMENSLS